MQNSKNQNVIKPWERPENFPIGSPRSRAAARAMLAARESEEFQVVITTSGMADRVEYFFDKAGNRRQVGRELTLEERMNHPFFKDVNIKDLTPTPERTSLLKNAVMSKADGQAQQPLESDEARSAESAHKKPDVDPLAAVHRKKFDR